jgi:cystathionine beta-synthase
VALNPEVPIAYPRVLFDQRIEGDVVLRLFTDSTGRLIPESTRVAESSNYPALDSAALAGSSRLQFAPAKKRGIPVAAAFLQPVEFRYPGTTGGGTAPPVAQPRPATQAPARPRPDSVPLRADTARPLRVDSIRPALTYTTRPARTDTTRPPPPPPRRHHPLRGIRVAQHTKPYANVLETIGWTPLIRLGRVTRGLRTPVYAKAEFFNPGGSVKDRIGIAMIEAAEREGRLKPGGLIVEATSGNTGVGLAIAAAVKGYRCIFTMPDKMSQEKARLLRALGAEVIITPTAVPPDHPDNYIMKGRAIAAAHENAIFADQHYNPVNPEVHYRTTGPEIWEQTEGKVTHFVCAPGTGGTVSGAGRYLKERNPKIRVVAGDPVGSIYTGYAQTRRKTEGQPYKVEGIGGDKIPTSLHFDVIDEWIWVSDKDAMLMARRLAKDEGLFVGGSTGVNIVSALDVARRLDDPKALVVTILCDTGERYLSKVYNDEWLRENQMLDDARPTVAGLITAKDGGGPALIHVAPEASVRQALNLMNTYNVSQLPVLAGEDGVGAVSEQALMARALEDAKVLDSPVREVMDPPFPVVDSHWPVDRLAELLSRETPAALVRRDGTTIGIVTRYDVLHQLAGIR